MSKHSKKLSKLKNQQGYTLIIVLLVLIVLSITGVSIMNLTSNTMNTMANERDDQTTYYIAEKALVETKALLDHAAKEAYKTTIKEYEINLSRKPENQLPPSYFKECFYNLLKSNIYSDSIGNSCSISQNRSIEKTFDSFTYQEYFGKLPTAEVTVGDLNPEVGFDENGKSFTLSAEGNIDGNGKVRTLSQQLDYKITGLDFESGEPGGDEGITISPKYTVQVKDQIDVKDNPNALKLHGKLATSLSQKVNDGLSDENDEENDSGTDDGSDKNSNGNGNGNGNSENGNNGNNGNGNNGNPNIGCGPYCIYNIEFPNLDEIIAFIIENDDKYDNITRTSTYTKDLGSFEGVLLVDSGDFNINGGAVINGIIIAPSSHIKLNGQATINGVIFAQSFEAKNGEIDGNPISITIGKKPLPPTGSIGISIDEKQVLEQ